LIEIRHWRARFSRQSFVCCVSFILNFISFYQRIIDNWSFCNQNLLLKFKFFFISIFNKMFFIGIKKYIVHLVQSVVKMIILSIFAIIFSVSRFLFKILNFLSSIYLGCHRIFKNLSLPDHPHLLINFGKIFTNADSRIIAIALNTHNTS
jgi:hypothetical protein